jgi:hypothetical protein
MDSIITNKNGIGLVVLKEKSVLMFKITADFEK